MRITKTMWLVVGIVGWIAIFILSVLPAEERPHTGAGGFMEHFAAYALVAYCLTRGISYNRAAWWIVPALSFGALLLEFVQLYIPGRSADLKGFVSAATGAALGWWIHNRVRRYSA